MGVRRLCSNIGIAWNESEVDWFFLEEILDFVDDFLWRLHGFMSCLFTPDQKAMWEPCPVYRIRIHIGCPTEHLALTGEAFSPLTLSSVVESRTHQGGGLREYILSWPGTKAHESMHLKCHVWKLRGQHDSHVVQRRHRGCFRLCPPCSNHNSGRDQSYSYRVHRKVVFKTRANGKESTQSVGGNQGHWTRFRLTVMAHHKECATCKCQKKKSLITSTAMYDKPLIGTCTSNGWAGYPPSGNKLTRIFLWILMKRTIA